MKNITKFEIYNLIREIHMSMILSLIISTSILTVSFYLINLFQLQNDILKNIYMLVASFGVTFFICNTSIIHVYYNFKKNGNFITYLLSRFSVYKVWLIKTTAMFFVVYSLFLTATIFSIVVIIILKIFGSIESIIYFGNIYEIVMFFVLCPVFAVTSAAFFEGLFLLIISDIGEAVILPSVISMALFTIGIYFIRKISSFDFLMRELNDNYLASIGLFFLLCIIFMLIPALICRFVKIEKIIMRK